MAAVAYDTGSTYRAFIDVTDPVTGLPVNAAACVLTVTWRDAAGAQTATPTVPAPSPQGHYSVDYLLAEAATYTFRWQTTNPGQVVTDIIPVRDYVCAVPFAAALEWLGVTNPASYAKVRALAGLATKVAERVCGPTVPRRFVNEWIPGASRPVLRVPRPPLPDVNAVESVVSVYPGGPQWPRDGALIVNPAAGTLRLASYLDFWWGPWTVTYTAGRLVLSENITGAVLEILDDLWATQRWQSPDSQAPDASEVAAYELQLPPGYLPPPRAVELLQADAQPGFG